MNFEYKKNVLEEGVDRSKPTNLTFFVRLVSNLKS
jgi:hypothetical protein